jgi:ATP-dependent Clp protease ATP-binding subunit ClpB
VGQPSAEDTISILRGLKKRYESYHGVEIADSALVAAAVLSDRYIADRFLPDKAIDLVDEAAAKLKMEITSKPEELEGIERRLMQLEMEKLSLEAENGTATKASRTRLSRIEQEIAELQAKQTEFSGQWQSEKQALEAINALKEEEDQIRIQIPAGRARLRPQQAAQLKYGRLEAIQRDRETLEAQLIEVQAQGNTLLREQVTEADIAEIVAKWTGIPVNRLMESERQKLLQLEGHLHERIIGQTKP